MVTSISEVEDQRLGDWRLAMQDLRASESALLWVGRRKMLHAVPSLRGRVEALRTRADLLLAKAVDAAHRGHRGAANSHLATQHEAAPVLGSDGFFEGGAVSDDAISEAFAVWERARRNVQELEARLAAARLLGNPQVVADLSAEFELRKRQADELLAVAIELVKDKPGTS